MNWLDVIIVFILLFLALIGFRRGLIKTVIPLVGVILGIVLAGRLHGHVADWLNIPSKAEVASFAIIFIVVMAAAMILAWTLHRFVHLLFLGWVDRLGGLAFGFVLGGTASAAFLAVLAKFPFWDMDTTIQNSSIAAFFLDKFPFVFHLLPKEFDAVRQFFG